MALGRRNQDTLTVHVDGDMELLETVWIHSLDDPEGPYTEIDPANYSVTAGSTIITLHQDYFDSLPEGRHELIIQFFDGDARVRFQVGSSLSGDTNGDGEVNGKDGVLLAQYLAGWDTPVNLGAADVNGDGDVNGKDGILLAQYLAGWDITLG